MKVDILEVKITLDVQKHHSWLMEALFYVSQIVSSKSKKVSNAVFRCDAIKHSEGNTSQLVQ